MASADRLELQNRPFALLRGDVVIPEIRLARPDVRLETGPGGGGNWDFGMEDSGDGEPPRLQRIWIDDGHLQFVDAATHRRPQPGCRHRARRRGRPSPGRRTGCWRRRCR